MYACIAHKDKAYRREDNMHGCTAWCMPYLLQSISDRWADAWAGDPVRLALELKLMTKLLCLTCWVHDAVTHVWYAGAGMPLCRPPRSMVPTNL